MRAKDERARVVLARIRHFKRRRVAPASTLTSKTKKLRKKEPPPSTTSPDGTYVRCVR